MKRFCVGLRSSVLGTELESFQKPKQITGRYVSMFVICRFTLVYNFWGITIIKQHNVQKKHTNKHTESKNPANSQKIIQALKPQHKQKEWTYILNLIRLFFWFGITGVINNTTKNQKKNENTEEWPTFLTLQRYMVGSTQWFYYAIYIVSWEV